MSRRLGISTFALILWIAMACDSAATPTVNPTADSTPEAALTAAPTSTLTPAATSSPAATPAPLLRDGPLAPGTYTFMHQNVCDDPPRDCPAGVTPPPALGIELTVPAGWTASPDFYLIAPQDGRETDAPNNSALVMGWTNFWVGLNSEPCSQTSHQVTDTPVGPSVDDFIDAVIANDELDITEPVDVELGGYSGRSFTLTGPDDLSGCEEWRPWDPGFFAQGPSNIWDVWAIDVDGFRVLIVATYFPQTPDDVKTELRAIAESIRFVP
jgi:hypothetical protein